MTIQRLLQALQQAQTGGSHAIARRKSYPRDFINRLLGCVDHCHPASVESGVESLAAQRLEALALGCEDLHDHCELRVDAGLPLLVGQSDPTGEQRVRARARGQAWASPSTLNRLELGAATEAARDRPLRGAPAGGGAAAPSRVPDADPQPG